MIDFRYHLISIIAVFLALAIGIVLGTTALNSALLDDLRANISSLTQDKDDLRGQVADLQTRLDDAGAFTEATASALLAGRLAGRQVVVLAAPGAPGDVREAVVAGVEDAGGEVVGPVLLQADYLTREPAEVDDLVRRLAPAGVTLPAGSGAERLGSLLASVLVTTSTTAPGATGPDAPDATTTTDRVLDGLRDAGLVRVQGETPEPAPLAVLVAAPGPVEGEAVDEEVLRQEQQALLALALAFRSRSLGTVVAGPDEPPGGRGLVATLRADDAVADQLSSVDDAGSPQGRVATVFSLLEAWRGGVGHYGRGDRTSGPLPVPLPAG
ncbi:MAG: copper transporter, partial [Actinomycetota bacterium]|nr:copper transporter [Actinomycetota bacterium]